ncbi:MAG: hypothetical protein E7665_07870 [Ruminococcaceae bacterium]|nr:hypothetical protein [Oscillospiraceae bacterium]
MVITDYTISAPIEKEILISHISDLHDRPFDDIKRAFNEKRPDIILLTGDIFNRGVKASPIGYDFLNFVSSVAPVFYSLGNHERYFTDEDREDVKKCSVTLLEDRAERIHGINICGLSSGYCHTDSGKKKITPPPDLEKLEEFSRLSGFKLLMCHHPEYYLPYIKNKDIDLVLSGHAHGGQIRIFNKGIYAPGQGLFPKLTSGMFDKRIIISRGLAATGGMIPRINNECELVYITLTPDGRSLPV